MSRHRNVRSMNYSDEYDGYDDIYGHSVEDDYTISPSDAAFMYDRSSRQPQMSIYLKGEEDIAEEDEQSSKDYIPETSNKIDTEKLAVCLEEVKNVLGETYPEQMLINTIVEKKYDTAVVVDSLLNKTPYSKKEATDSPKPQRLTSLRSSERGGSGNDHQKTSRNSGNHRNERMLKDVTPLDTTVSVNMDVDFCSLKKYKKIEIDFSQVLIGTSGTNTKEQVSNNINKESDEGIRSSVNKYKQDSIGNSNERCIRTFKKCRHPLYTSHLSKVGCYLCMKYVELPAKMKLNFVTQSTITPFKFDTRSPDEVTKKSFVVVKKLDHKFKF